MAAHGSTEHEEALLIHLVQAARRVDDEVGAEPPLGKGQFVPRGSDKNEPSENTRRLREREEDDDDGPERMRLSVRERNAAQGQGTLHRVPSPVPATSIQRAGRTPYCRSTFAPLSDGVPEASTNCVANP